MGLNEDAIALDPAWVLSMARSALGRPTAVLGTWHAEPLSGMGGASIHRVAGTVVEDGASVPWSVIRKSVRDTGGDATDIRYWRREPLAYDSGLLGQLAGIEVPRCIQQVEDDGGVVLWLEDISADPGPWTLSRFETAARDLGRLGGAYAGGRPLPEAPWLSRRWLEAWVEQAATAFDGFEREVSDPLLARLYNPDVAAAMRALWDERHQVFEALRATQQVLGHLDATPVNVIVRDGRTTLIDWAFVGHAALGEELASLVGGSTLFGDTSPDDLADVDAVAFPAYIAGLGDAGWDSDLTRVRFAYCAAAAMRYCVGPAAFMVRGINPDGSIADGVGIRDADQRAFLETSFGLPFADLLEVASTSHAFLAARLGREALQLLERAGE